MDEPRRALVTGITGQDGGQLTELLHAKGYEIYGLLRGQANARKEMFALYEFPYVRLDRSGPDRPDLADPGRHHSASRPHEIYNLGAISHVGYSFRNPQLTADMTGKGVLNLLEAVRITGHGGARALLPGIDLGDVWRTRLQPARFRLQRGLAVPPAQSLRRRQALCPLDRPGTYRESSTPGCSSPPASCSTTRASGAGWSSVTRKITNAVAKIHLGSTTTSRSVTCGPSATGATPATTFAACGRCSSTTSPTTSSSRPGRPTRSRSS